MNEPPAQNSFLTDVNVNGPAIDIAVRFGVTIVRAVDISMGTADDSDLLAYAIEHSYVLVTGNFEDFPSLVTAMSSRGQHHSGVLIIRSKVLKNSTHIAEMLALYASEEMVDRVEWI
jgi:hypothetical protein